MSESPSTEQKEQGPEVDWTALKIAVDDMNTALALVRGSFITIRFVAHKLTFPSLTGSSPATLTRPTETMPLFSLT
jgi:hypothetical protein